MKPNNDQRKWPYKHVKLNEKKIVIRKYILFRMEKNRGVAFQIRVIICVSVRTETIILYTWITKKVLRIYGLRYRLRNRNSIKRDREKLS